MITLGIDLSSQPAGTVACLIEWRRHSAVARAPRLACTDDVLAELIEEADGVGIDAPLGWPADFVAAVSDWTLDRWTNDDRDRMRFRETDRVVRAIHKIIPLSVSSDLIALPAMRAMALLRRFGVKDRAGDGRFFEVYPAASLLSWGLSRRGYKQPENTDARRKLLNALRRKLPWLKVPVSYAHSADALDALVASLTARAAMQGLTAPPSSLQRHLARREGWIHVTPTGVLPTCGS